MREQTTNTNNNIVAVNELTLIAEKSKLKKLKKKLLCKLAELGDADDVDVDVVNKITITIENIDKILNKLEDKDEGVNEVVVVPDIPKRAVNTKEDIQILKALTLGNEEFEDWQLTRKLFRVGIIRLLYAIPENK